MDPKRWRQADEVFQAALERDPEDRSAFINEVCGDDDSLRREVEALLAADGEAGSLIETPAYAVAAPLIVGKEAPSFVGQNVGHYRIISLVGKGGMGEVYRARDIKLDRAVALKILPADVSTDAERMRRFVREAKAASALNHPNVATIYEIGEANGMVFIAMEYVEGKTLATKISGRPLTLNEIVEIGSQIADALEEAHDKGITHRDIKPANVMLNERGQVKVLDFGLAKIAPPSSQAVSSDISTLAKTASGVVLGTVPYMSPEQALGREVDQRSDLFSLGVTLYEMATGQSPFAGANTVETLDRILHAQPEAMTRFNNEIPADLERIVNKCLDKDPERRYQTGKKLLIDLKDLHHKLEFAAEASAGEIAMRGRPVALLPGLRAIAGKRWVLGTLVTLLVTAATVAFFYLNRKPVLTDKDTILLADFVNSTGEAVFDGTLKQALAVQLEQSPFLNIFSEERVRESLRLMKRGPNEPLTPEVARELCQRQGIKALLLGSIAKLDRNYVITLEAINGQTGDAIARQQVEAEGKDQALKALGGAATKLRERLGESLASIKQFDAPLEQVTTSSLEALKAYTLAAEAEKRNAPYEEMILYLKRAIDLDPNFAKAYQFLASAYQNNYQPGLAFECAQKAFELRERTSEREKLLISLSYYTNVTGELDKAIEVLMIWKRNYPREGNPLNGLAMRYSAMGQWERAVEEAREAVRIDPQARGPYANLGYELVSLNRFEEARDVYESALQQKLDFEPYHTGLYRIAFVRGDAAAMQRQIDWATGKPSEHSALTWQAETAAFAGKLRQAQEFFHRAIDLAERRNLKELAAGYKHSQVNCEAAFGICQPVRADTYDAQVLKRERFFLVIMASALAQCGEVAKAQALASELTSFDPQNTLVNALTLPTIRAAIELRRGNPDQVIHLLRPALRFEGGDGGYRGGDLAFRIIYQRGQAYLLKRSGAEAAAEFQKILEHRGWAPTSYFYPLAHLGLARAMALTGYTAKSRKTYQDFFALWKDADASLPVLLAAKREYAALK